MTQPVILIVVLNYRTPAMTLRAVEAAAKAMQDLNSELVIVDNDSQDGSAARIEEGLRTAVWAQGQPIRLVRSGHNGGFGAGNNLGIDAGRIDGTRPDYVYILNSDAFPSPDAIRRLLDHLQTHPEAGFAGSYIHGPEGDPHVTAFRFPSVWSELEGAARLGPLSRLLARRRVPLGVPEATQRVDWLAGASLMMRRGVLDRIGPFDETYFLYFEETDLCLRAARAGYETHYVRDSHVAHIGSVSTGMKTWDRMPDYWFDSRWHYFAKNHGRGYALAATAAHLLGGLSWRLRRLIQRKPPADPPGFLRSLLWHDLRAFLGRRGKSPVPPAAAPLKAKPEHTS